MILITGANGHLGSQTIDFLLSKNPNTNLAGLVRSEKKGLHLKEKGVDLRIGDYSDYDSLLKALEGIDTLLLISSSTLEGRIKQHKNVIEAAKTLGVNQIFYTSIVQAEKKLSPLSQDHFETEKILKRSGIDYTIYRNTFYMEFLPLFLGNAIENRKWFFPSEGEAINLALRSEMAESLAVGLTDPKTHRNSIYEITSGKSYTLNEISNLLSQTTGTDIPYSDLSTPYFADALKKLRLPEDQVAMSLMTAETFVNGALDFAYKDLENLLGRKPTDLSIFIEQTYGQ